MVFPWLALHHEGRAFHGFCGVVRIGHGLAADLHQPLLHQSRAEAAGAKSLGVEQVGKRQYHDGFLFCAGHSIRPMRCGLNPQSAALPLRPRAAAALLRLRISSVSSRGLPPRPVPCTRMLRV